MHLNNFKCLFFYKPVSVQENYFSQMSPIHPDIFPGWALWADRVSSGMNTTMSHDQFNPIRIGKNLVMNYNTL